ncbi:MAG: hypothetical protein ABJA86_07770 [Nocardioidaceae bacterium]
MFESLSGAELAAALAATRDLAALPDPAASGPPDPADPASADDSVDPDGGVGQGLGELVDRVTAADRLIGWATGVQARAVSALAAGYEQHYLADLPAGASSEHRGEVVAEAVKDCAVELGMARVTGINAASNLVRFADELTADHPRLLAALERGEISSWNIRAVLAETRVLPRSLRR